MSAAVAPGGVRCTNVQPVSDVVVSTPPAINSPMTETSCVLANAEPSTWRPATISLTASARGRPGDRGSVRGCAVHERQAGGTGASPARCRHRAKMS